MPTAGADVAPIDVRGTMSADGHRLAFVSAGDGSHLAQLYLHVDGEPSRWVSQPEGGNQSDPVNVNFEGMTPDGKSVFFTSESPLLNGDIAPGPDLYRFTDSANPAADDNLTLITNDGLALSDPTGFGDSLVGMSDDGRRVYVHSNGAKLLLWEEGLGLKTIDPFVPRTPTIAAHLDLSAKIPGNGRVSPDGSWLAYVVHDEGHNIPDQMYVYSREDDSVTCVSCPLSASLVPTLTKTGQDDIVGFRPRFLSPDGRVFFTSPGALVPEDTNGVDDVYEYDGPSGKLRLISSGKGSEPAQFVDASASGDDVFVVTRQRLVPADTDDYIDLYDVRAGAAPAEHPTTTAPACGGDGCQASPSAAPADVPMATSLVRGGRQGPSPVRTRLSVSGSRTFRGPTGSLRVTVNRAGRVIWSGSGLAGGSRSRSSAGPVMASLRLSGAARRRLQRSSALRHDGPAEVRSDRPHDRHDRRACDVQDHRDEEGMLSMRSLRSVQEGRDDPGARSCPGVPISRYGIGALGPAIRVSTLVPDHVTPGEFMPMYVNVINVGDVPLSGNLTIKYTIPAGLSVSDPIPQGLVGAVMHAVRPGQ